METTIFVVSDLHLGGAKDFQMCSPSGQARLAQLFEWIAGQAGTGRRIELVIAGDIVDFLAVEDKGGGTWSAFTSDEGEALWKLESIFRSTRTARSRTRTSSSSTAPTAWSRSTPPASSAG